MEYLQRLVAYTRWANGTWLDFVYDNAGGDAYLARLISHVYLAEQVWFQRIYAEDVDKDVFKTRPQQELRALDERHRARFTETFGMDLTRVIAYRRFTGEALESSVSDILMHLVTHGAHHRGQMATYACQNKMGPPNTDYFTYTRNSA